MALILLCLVASVRRCGTQELDFDDKEVTMNHFNTLRLQSIFIVLNKQIPEALNTVRGDGTG
jgi:hypothetical protein